ncbi:MAG: hypothetical protein R3A48_07760 [Polyangiales bacterium]
MNLRPSLLAPFALLAACETTATSLLPDASRLDVADVATDAVDDAKVTPDDTGCGAERPTDETVYPRALYLAPGQRATVVLRTARDRCVPAPFAVRVENAAVATASAERVTVISRTSTANVDITAVAAGTTTVTIGNASLAVTVAPTALPECPMNTPATTGMLTAGAIVRGTSGSPLAEASVSLPMLATEIPAMEVSIACATQALPEGYTAIGPAVRFDPQLTRLPREVPFTVPVNPTRVPTGYELQVEFVYSSALHPTPRVVPVADAHLTDDGRAMTFSAPRLGTWQAVIRTGLGTRTRQRRFTYHSILGVSMGAAGAASIGTRNPDRFDFVAPLGGPVDWNYQLHYIHDYHVAGFCTAAERAMNPAACEMGASITRTPPVTDLFERQQHFEEWFFPDGWGGQGGTFDRESYTQIFRDLTRMFGNAIVPSGSDGVQPMGVPTTEGTRTNNERCANPVTLMNWFDRDFNPDGTLPVVTFCDGTHEPNRRGLWDGGRGYYPMEVSLAVDVNRNGRRDRGEPVLRQFYEPWQDTGADGVPSSMEPGYDARTNPDPAGDDYDRQFNPGGTEGNFVYEMGEPFEDVGVDGVACPAGRTCPYDLGEGNGRFDTTPGTRRFWDVGPRNTVARMPLDSLNRLDFWVDGGTRDLFLFGTVSNHFVGSLAQRGRSLHYFNNFAPIGAGRVPETNFPYDTIDWARVPGTAMLRYGTPDAMPGQLIDGDGGHVGTIPQITNRMFAGLYWMQARWPGGDRRVEQYTTEVDNEGRCATGHFCTFDFRSEATGRTGPVSVYLPPGYHDPANRDLRYPVVYFLHGYGMEPQQLVATGLIVGNFMSSASLPSWRRPQKFIMVFPDGRCRQPDGCIRGTFYTDSPVGNAQMERYFLDLYDYIDRSYRVRAPETLEVTE